MEESITKPTNLGIEFNTGGQIFRHYSLPENAFNGKTKSQIIKLQQSIN